MNPQFARSSCDTLSGSDRLCVHTGGNQVNGGYRCGDSMGLNGDWYWVRCAVERIGGADCCPRAGRP